MLEEELFLNVMDQAIRGPKTVFLAYETRGGQSSGERHLELYSLTPGREEAILRAYQLAPEEGWRYFMLDKITSIRIGNAFQPRQKVQLVLGELEDKYNPWPEGWDDTVIEYRNMVIDVLSDMRVNDAERTALDHFRRDSGIVPEQVRGVHYMIFKNCLEQIILDGVVKKEEFAQIKELNACLQRCGAGILE